MPPHFELIWFEFPCLTVGRGRMRFGSGRSIEVELEGVH